MIYLDLLDSLTPDWHEHAACNPVIAVAADAEIEVGGKPS